MLGNQRPIRALSTAMLLAACVPLLACGSDASPLRVGQEPDESIGGQGGFQGPGAGSGPGPTGDGGIVRGREALTVRVQDVGEMTIELITLACAGDCADIEAVAHGGNPPYAFAWEDGSTTAARRVCLDADKTLTVTATDTAIETDELAYQAQSTSADVTATVLACADGGTPPTDAGRCDAATDLLPPEELAADIFGVPTFFAGGVSLPAGRYRIAYADGCMMYDASWAWTVQGLPTFQFQLIGATTADFLAVLPGTEAPIGVGITGYPIYEDCIAANRALPPLDFDFAGGKLGIWQNDFKTDDNIAGEQKPTWRLSQLPCP